MERFMVRAAQAGFHRAGYTRGEALARAERLAASILANPDAYQAEFGITDELELAYQVARRMAPPRPELN